MMEKISAEDMRLLALLEGVTGARIEYCNKAFYIGVDDEKQGRKLMKILNGIRVERNDGKHGFLGRFRGNGKRVQAGFDEEKKCLVVKRP